MQNLEVLNQPSIETKKNYKKSINEIISVSSIQFLTSPFRTKRLVIKLVWTSFLITFFCLSINYCIENLNDYLNFDTITSIQTINEQESDFPTIDITQRKLPIFAYGNITKTNNFTNNNGLFKFPEFNTYENVSKTFYSINVYYSDLKYLLIKQQPKIELFGLISNIGGILGLFLSFSFISLLEIFEILAEYLFIYFK